MSARPTYERWLKEWSDIQAHLPALEWHARGNCMEIGVRGGVSTSALLAGLEEHGGHLLSVDIDDCGGVFKGHPLWTFCHLDSQRDVERVKAMLPHRLDLLLVDGDHTYEAVEADLTNYGPRADCVLLHDTEAAEWPGVRQAVEKYVAMSGRQVKWHTGSYGMAEITR